MKRKIFRMLSIVIAMVLFVSLPACGTNVQTPASSETKADGVQASATETSTAQPSEKVTVTVWTGYPESGQDASSKAFYRVLEKAKTDLPNIIIEHDGTECEAYKTKIKTAMAANEAPDVFYSFGAGFVKPFVDADKVLPLDDYLTDVKDRINPGANDYFIFNDKTYGLTAYKWLAVLYCNKELFDNNGIKMPDTYDELLTAVKAFRAKGIDPIAVGEKDKWPGMFWQNAFALRTAGAKVCNDALGKNASFDQPSFVESAAKLKELVDAGAFIDGCMGLTEAEGYAPFLQGQVPMYYMGEWFAANIASEDSKVKDKVTVKKFPALNESNQDEWLGGAIDGFCVNSNAKNKEAAVTVLKYIAEGISKELVATGEGIPTWDVPDATGEVNPVFQQILDMSADATNYVLAWDTFLEGADADTHKNLVADIFGGKITPEDFAKEMQKLNE